MRAKGSTSSEHASVDAHFGPLVPEVCSFVHAKHHIGAEPETIRHFRVGVAAIDGHLRLKQHLARAKRQIGGRR